MAQSEGGSLPGSNLCRLLLLWDTRGAQSVALRDWLATCSVSQGRPSNSSYRQPGHCARRPFRPVDAAFPFSQRWVTERFAGFSPSSPPLETKHSGYKH